MIKTLDINHPSVGWAKKYANKTKKPHCIVANSFGGFDIKLSETVTPYVNNPLIAAEIYPDNYFDKVVEHVTPVFKYSKVSV